MAEVQFEVGVKTLGGEKYVQEREELDIQNGLLIPGSTLDIHLPRTYPASNLLVTSPYTELPHLLDLSTLDTPNRLMALALQNMQPTTTSYATEPYLHSFNWPLIITSLKQLCTAHNHTWKETSFYCVVFTSQLRPSCNYPDLSALDKLSHAEAMSSGGFLKYWFGSPNEERRNLATCIWRSKVDARSGSTGPYHRRAAMAARPSYESFVIQGLRFVVGDGVKDWRIETWVD